MKKAGRMSLVLLAVIVAVVIGGVVLILFLSGEAPESVASNFLVALGKGDIKTLTKLSYMGSIPSAEIEKKWDFTLHVADPYYHFRYLITGAKQLDAETAAVNIEMQKDSNKPNAIPESYQLPLVKIENHWKVDLRAINREIYPALPRATD